MESSQAKERNVYYFNQALEIKEYRATAIDVFENVMVIGNEKGYVYPYEISVNPKDKKKCSFDPLHEGGKTGKDKVEIVKYLPRCLMIAVLM